MDQVELEKVARAHAVLITRYSGLDAGEALVLACKVVQYVTSNTNPDTTTVGASVDNVSVSPPVVQVDVPPPSQADNTGSGGVLVPKGYQCYCSQCKVEHYEVQYDILAVGVGINTFLRAYKSLGQAPELTREMLDVFKDKVGRTLMDCPVCKGSKCLQLSGPVNKEEVPEDLTDEVSSVRGQ